MIGIVSCEQYIESRVPLLDDAWKNDCRIPVVVFTGANLHVPDDYDHLPHKVQAMCRYALAEGYEYLFKCDDDTFVNVDRLLRSGFEKFDYAGRFNSATTGWATGGTGYWLSKRAMRVISEAGIADWAEDRFVGTVLRRAGIRCHRDTRYTLLPDETLARPDFITACCTDTDIRAGFALARALLCSKFL
jgi:hypothetical protein